MSALAAAESSSTEPPSFLQPNLTPVALKYIPLPEPLSPPSDPITVIASEGMRMPCRRCLLDASPGESLHLIAYDPFPNSSKSPYRSSSPIFVHAHDCGLFNGDELPERQLKRLLSVRAYDEKDMIVACEVIEGRDFEATVGGMLADSKAKWVGVYNAKPGCFAVRIEKARDDKGAEISIGGIGPTRRGTVG